MSQSKVDEAQAKRQAEMTRPQAGAKSAPRPSRKQAEIDRRAAEEAKKQGKAVAEAEAKLKAAQAAYKSRTSENEEAAVERTAFRSC